MLAIKFYCNALDLLRYDAQRHDAAGHASTQLVQEPEPRGLLSLDSKGIFTSTASVAGLPIPNRPHIDITWAQIAWLNQQQTCLNLGTSR